GRHGVAIVRSTCKEKRAHTQQGTGAHAHAPFDLDVELRSNLRAVHQLASLHSEVRSVTTPIFRGRVFIRPGYDLPRRPGQEGATTSPPHHVRTGFGSSTLAPNRRSTQEALLTVCEHGIEPLELSKCVALSGRHPLHPWPM